MGEIDASTGLASGFLPEEQACANSLRVKMHREEEIAVGNVIE
jgi:hypothetical protein